jgi:hypothetical protein
MEHSRRREPRVVANIWVTIERTGPRSRFDAVAVNLGLGGAFIESEPSLSYGEMVIVHLPLPGLPGALALTAVVRWKNDAGFGVQFLEMGAKETHALAQALAALVGVAS